MIRGRRQLQWQLDAFGRTSDQAKEARRSGKEQGRTSSEEGKRTRSEDPLIGQQDPLNGQPQEKNGRNTKSTTVGIHRTADTGTAPHTGVQEVASSEGISPYPSTSPLTYQLNQTETCSEERARNSNQGANVERTEQCTREQGGTANIANDKRQERMRRWRNGSNNTRTSPWS